MLLVGGQAPVPQHCGGGGCPWVLPAAFERQVEGFPGGLFLPRTVTRLGREILLVRNKMDLLVYKLLISGVLAPAMIQDCCICSPVCIGEKLEKREAGKTTEVCFRQLSAMLPNISDWSMVVLAYESILAIWRLCYAGAWGRVVRP